MKTPFWPVPLGSKPIDLGLERVVEALQKMGNPHLKLPPVIHIAGTNGKGSTLAFLRAILEAECYKCHVYTSPHLVEFNERIVVAGEKISDEFLTEVLNETKKLTEGINLTFFEGTTSSAILAFSKVKADFVLLETGMGGRLDATNIIDDPLLTIITPISLDHTEFLGDTLEKIAYEKACIMKRGTPCVIAPQVVEVEKVLRDYAEQVGSKIINHQALTINNQLSLLGKHQYINAAVAIAAAHEIKKQGYKISDEAIVNGITSAKWLARLQDVSDVFGMEIYLDGSHNPQGAETIAEFLKEKNNETVKDSYLIIGMLKNKDMEGFLKNLKNIKKIFFIEIPNEPNSATPEDLKRIANKVFSGNLFSNSNSHTVTPQQVRGDNNSVEIETANNLETALNNISNTSGNNRTIICGSLYLAGWVLENYIN